jgi:transcriptional regulator GlxA family with amidase domain
LLTGRPATTTWWLDRLFRARYPKVDLNFRSVLTEADRLLCAGATATHMLQAIRIISEFHGPTVAAQCARTMLIDVSQTGNLPYLPLLTETTHNDTLVTRAQAWLDANMSREITIGALARAMSISERSLARRFRAAIGKAPLVYLQSARLNAARALLETGDASVQSIAHRVGYADASSFSRLFSRHFGLSPGAYRSRFQLFEGVGSRIG